MNNKYMFRIMNTTIIPYDFVIIDTMYCLC